MPAPPWAVAPRRRRSPFPASGTCCCFSAQPLGQKSSLLHTCAQAHARSPARPVLQNPPASPGCSSTSRVPAGHPSRGDVSSCSSGASGGTSTDPAHPRGPLSGAPCHPRSTRFLSPLPPVSWGFSLISAGEGNNLPCTSPRSLDPSCSSSCFQPAAILELKITRNLQPSTLSSAKLRLCAVSAKCSMAHPGFSSHLCSPFPLGHSIRMPAGLASAASDAASWSGTRGEMSPVRTGERGAA